MGNRNNRAKAPVLNRLKIPIYSVRRTNKPINQQRNLVVRRRVGWADCGGEVGMYAGGDYSVQGCGSCDLKK